MSKILIFLIIFINSLTVFSAETEEEILSKADQLYNEQLYADAIVEYNKLINSNSNFYKGNAYLGLADSNYWIENNEKLSLSFYDIVFENKLLLREINNSLKVTMYMRIAWLNDFISNYPYSFKFYSLSISTYEKYFNNKKDENSFSDYCVSLYNKAILFYEGTGTKQNFQKSFELFKKSSSLCEDSESMNYLGVMYEQGTGTEQNFTSAIEWYFKSMTMEIEPSLWSKINYAFLLANGYGIEKDLELAKSYLNEVINDEIKNIRDSSKNHIEDLKKKYGYKESWAVRLTYNEVFGGVAIQQLPGEGNRLHKHPNVAECWVILKGKWKWFIEGQGDMEVSEGSIVNVPKNTFHQNPIKNTVTHINCFF